MISIISHINPNNPRKHIPANRTTKAINPHNINFINSINKNIQIPPKYTCGQKDTFFRLFIYIYKLFITFNREKKWVFGQKCPQTVAITGFQGVDTFQKKCPFGQKKCPKVSTKCTIFSTKPTMAKIKVAKTRFRKLKVSTNYRIYLSFPSINISTIT